MKRKALVLLTMLLLFALAVPATAQYGPDQSVRGYIKRDGTYVKAYHRTAPDNNQFNNYSTQGNINPYTGQMGTVNPYSQPAPSGQQRQRKS